VRRRDALALLLGALAVPSAFAQSAPPDLDPKLTGKPVSATQDKSAGDKPKLQEPPRAPAVPDLSTIAPPAAAPASSPSR
jgi:hypothetical protein